jgi:hypothetical protein
MLLRSLDLRPAGLFRGMQDAVQAGLEVLSGDLEDVQRVEVRAGYRGRSPSSIARKRTASWKYSGTGLAGSSVFLSRMISTTSFDCVSAR